MRRIKNIASALIILIAVLLAAQGSAFAANYDDAIFNKEVPETIEYITVNHKEISGRKYSIDVPYSDEFFDMPSRKFNMYMARASMGMAVSAMRDWDVPDDQGHNIIRFLSEAGFGDIEASLYRTEPTENSICYAMANKEIDDYKVLCIALCGAGYKKEWISNLLIGDDVRHQGFNEAAQKVEEAIYEYIKVNNIRGKVKVWITGYSRSAAVGNLVAEDLIISGLFEDLYAYLFATPRTTKNPISYKNIFNIIGKNDFVPKIPLAEWGYGRNGIELYTKTQETDSDYIYAYRKVNDYTAKHDMQMYLNNPELNYQIRTIFDYMAKLMPTSADYEDRLQDILISVMRDTSKDNILSSIVKAMQQFSPRNSEEQLEVSALLDYLQLLINQYVLQGNEKQILQGFWNPDLSLADNFVAEHDPPRYVSWLYCSDDVNDIFSPNTESVKLTIEGNCTVDICNDAGYILSIDQAGNFYYDENDDNFSDLKKLFLENEYTALLTESDETKKVITLPQDRNWTLTVTADKTANSGISYIAVGLSGTTSKAKTSKYYSINTQKGETYQISIKNNMESLVDEKNSYFSEASEYLSTFYSPSMVMRIDRLNIPYLTISDVVVIILILAAVAILDILLSIILGIIRVARKKKRRPGATIVLHCVNIIVFSALEVMLWSFASAFPAARYVGMGITCLIIIGLALKGIENKAKKTWRKVILIIIGTLMAAHVLIEILILKNIVSYEWIEPVIAYLIMTVLSCILYKRSPEEKEMQKNLEESLKLKRIEKKLNRKLKKENLKENLVMKNLIIPKDYDPKLNVRQTEEAIKYIRDTFQKEFGTEMRLERISAPLYVKRSSGLNDDLSGVERKVSFDAKELPGDELEIVQSLAKWKRWALGQYGFRPGEGLYTNMNAIRRDEELDNLHSIYVDQWDWERVITKEERTEETLKKTVEKIFKIIKHMEHEVWYKYPEAVYHLPDEIFFIDSEELRKLYPDLNPKERENAICKDKGAVFIMRIGDKLGDGKPHDGRAPDYDDWQLNGDILFWFEPLQQAFEISSMGIRVDEVSMKAQLEKAGKTEKLELTYHKMIMNKELPYTIGGGIGQSRLCMLLLGRAHVGEVQASVWPDEMHKRCEENNIMLL